MGQHQDMTQSLLTAKRRRSDASTAVADASIRAASAAAELKVCNAHVAELLERRAGCIAAAKPDDVIAVDAELLKARVAAEIARSRATASHAQHAAAVVELHAAETAVGEAARDVVLEEMVGLAAKFTAALDAALKIGAELQALAMRDHLRTPLNVSVPMLPHEVEDALARLPQPDQLNVPMHVLRNGVDSRAWAERVAELTA
jgi:hypothetical protein